MQRTPTSQQKVKQPNQRFWIWLSTQVEHVPKMHEALVSTSSTEKRSERKKEKKRTRIEMFNKYDVLKSPYISNY